jgi:phenol 2-monooxygenase
MQYYLNGFKPGDPTDFGATAESSAKPPVVDLPKAVDVLIVGCGPAGLVLASQLAAFADIKTRIVERKSGPLMLGQADGISGRSIEIFQSFGFADRVLKEAHFLEAITFWQHDADGPGNIVRVAKKIDGRNAYSEFPHVVLNQARVHHFLLDVMQKSPALLVPDYCRRLSNMEIDTSGGDYPVSVTLERTDPDHDGQQEVVAARYVVGCDGARSTVRQLLNLEMRGDSASKAWGVMDLLLVTDFPDIRNKSIIQSANEGNVLIIPREGGQMVRFYVEMDKLKESERVSSRNITVEQLIAAAGRILRPYTIDVKEVVWWSVYEIGQRLCDAFANISPGDADSGQPNVFIVGDACHTHSPKAGQGMNVSIHDSFNLGWKLASVLRGHSSPDILHTYAAERRAIAEELLAFDRELATMFSVQEESTAATNPGRPEASKLQQYMLKHDGYVSGTLTDYSPSKIVAEASHQGLARSFEIGKRFHSSPVVRLADARPVHLGHVLEADGRWRIIGFATAEDPTGQSSKIWRLTDFLQNAAESPVQKFTSSESDIDAVIEFLAVFQQGYREIDVQELHAFLSPSKGKYGLRDYDKLFCPDLDKGNDIFDARGIDRAEGCMVVVRPDQHVANVLPLDGFDELVTFFDGFMIPSDARFTPERGGSGD